MKLFSEYFNLDILIEVSHCQVFVSQNSFMLLFTALDLAYKMQIEIENLPKAGWYVVRGRRYNAVIYASLPLHHHT